MPVTQFASNLFRIILLCLGKGKQSDFDFYVPICLLSTIVVTNSGQAFSQAVHYQLHQPSLLPGFVCLNSGRTR